MSKHLSFGALDSAHIYEYLLMYWDGDGTELAKCAQCGGIATRLERFLGSTEVLRIQQAVRQNPKSMTVDERHLVRAFNQMDPKARRSLIVLAASAAGIDVPPPDA